MTRQTGRWNKAGIVRRIDGEQEIPGGNIAVNAGAGWSSIVILTALLFSALLVCPAAGTMDSPQPGVDIYGNNLFSGWGNYVNSVEECASQCDARSDCLAAVYVKPGVQATQATCWLKSAASPTLTDANTTTILKIQTMQCLVIIGWKADFSASKTTGPAPLSVSFTDTSSSGSNSWYWSFGDPCTSGCPDSGGSTQQNPVHSYQTPGTYDVELIVKDNCGTYHKEKKTSVITVTESAPAQGSLDISSTPSGATIYVDGNNKGTTSTTTWKRISLSPGSHSVRLSLNGYDDVTTSVTIIAGQVTQVNAPLTKASSPPLTTGSLQVISIPDGAAITLDGGMQGTTPKNITGLSAGVHQIKIAKSGYTEYNAPVSVTAGKTTQLTVPLVIRNDPSPVDTTPKNNSTSTGSIIISSSPSGAGINLDGWDKGITPTTLSQVKAGSHTLTLSLAGYENKILPVPVEAGKTTTVNAVMVRSNSSSQGGSGTLTIRSSPAGANVYLDGSKVGTTTLQLKGVKEGTHNLLLTMPGYGDVSQTFVITEGSDKDVTIDLGKKAPGFALPVLVTALVVVSLIARRRKTDR